jgi:hypothetical protein
MFGGLARLGRRARDPASELRIAVVGPATSLAIGVACLVLAGLIAGLDGPKFFTAAVTWLGVVNVVPAVFNLLPCGAARRRTGVDGAPVAVLRRPPVGTAAGRPVGPDPWADPHCARHRAVRDRRRRRWVVARPHRLVPHHVGPRRGGRERGGGGVGRRPRRRRDDPRPPHRRRPSRSSCSTTRSLPMRRRFP